VGAQLKRLNLGPAQSESPNESYEQSGENKNA